VQGLNLWPVLLAGRQWAGCDGVCDQRCSVRHGRQAGGERSRQGRQGWQQRHGVAAAAGRAACCSKQVIDPARGVYQQQCFMSTRFRGVEVLQGAGSGLRCLQCSMQHVKCNTAIVTRPAAYVTMVLPVGQGGHAGAAAELVWSNNRTFMVGFTPTATCTPLCDDIKSR